MYKFRQDDEIKIVNTGDVVLDNQICKICGVASTAPESVFYIIELQYPTEDEHWTHIVLTEHCLEREWNRG